MSFLPKIPISNEKVASSACCVCVFSELFCSAGASGDSLFRVVSSFAYHQASTIWSRPERHFSWDDKLGRHLGQKQEISSGTFKKWPPEQTVRTRRGRERQLRGNHCSLAERRTIQVRAHFRSRFSCNCRCWNKNIKRKYYLVLNTTKTNVVISRIKTDEKMKPNLAQT